jgi:GDPmannose 4,6-dehydratase
MKKALITGITGQDGSFLAEFLINKGYEVHGIKRRSSLFNTQRVDHLYVDPHQTDGQFRLHYGDLTDGLNIVKLINAIRPDEIYNLGAMSHVRVSFDQPEYTANVDGLGVLRLLEAVRLLGLGHKTRIYQASSSEMYGMAKESPQNEETPFHPRSPYGIAKLFAHHTIINYREAYGFFAVNGILFNHESVVRGETFVTRKITRAAVDIFYGKQDRLYLGNLNASRDWGHAKDYVKAMWLMLQTEKPEDFVIATGHAITVREFAVRSFKKLGIEIEFTGNDDGEKGLVKSVQGNISHLKKGDIIIEVDKNYQRPAEVESLLGDAAKARRILGWEPEHTVDDLIDEMINAEKKRF